MAETGPTADRPLLAERARKPKFSLDDESVLLSKAGGELMNTIGGLRSFLVCANKAPRQLG